MNVQKQRNIEVLSHTDQGGRADGLQIMVTDGYAYVAHMFSGGFSVLDVRDPRNPKTVRHVPAPPNTWSIHLQQHEDLLLVINAVDLFKLYTDESEYYGGNIGDSYHRIPKNYAAGLRVYDISKRDEPREIGFMPVEGLGLHRIWYVGGRYAYVSAHVDGYIDYIFMVIDMSDPTKPVEVGRWALPGMNAAAGETPSWGADQRYALHHGLEANGIVYSAWRDGGLVLLDVKDPTKPEMLSHLNWNPPFGGGTHSCLPLPNRGLVVVADEAVADECADGVKYTWVVDVRDPRHPVTISTFPTPDEDDYATLGGHFGPHNLHENRPGSFQSDTLIFATYQNAGVRVFDISNQFRPEEVAYFVPGPPEKMFDTRPNRPKVAHSADVFVDPNGVMYLSDWNCGLYILEYKG
ncbi:hypothetical protein HC028_25855 [Planosporangium flavigriseum]|uniref:LVIVD repeat-containing protein n=1 Tax=Planosporangium flavigriseum TaxID=373681 RepID=A0A8J3LRR6_9ACTN|nr:hypothetical protein [Planosporangium flavigriseum]NJC67904.1 hypothetical protein [Planosporangium flavigriseum]GIG76439.1 hypothetical protein Pfl04_48430 [Planosporangium flavigriseum]